MAGGERVEGELLFLHDGSAIARNVVNRYQEETTAVWGQYATSAMMRDYKKVDFIKRSLVIIVVQVEEVQARADATMVVPPLAQSFQRFLDSSRENSLEHLHYMVIGVKKPDMVHSNHQEAQQDSQQESQQEPQQGPQQEPQQEKKETSLAASAYATCLDQKLEDLGATRLLPMSVIEEQSSDEQRLLTQIVGIWGSAGEAAREQNTSYANELLQRLYISRMGGDAPTSRAEILIMYGSETGNAESIAQTLHEKSASRGFESTLCTLDEFRSSRAGWMVDNHDSNTTDREKRRAATSVPDKVNPRTVVVVTSTTGNGDAPKNAETFWRFIKKRSHPKDLLKDTKFLVLGLGDTNYDKFCNVGKIVDKRMGELGAERIKKIACADEGTSLDAVVEPWVAELWETLSEISHPTSEMEDSKKKPVQKGSSSESARPPTYKNGTSSQSISGNYSASKQSKQSPKLRPIPGKQGGTQNSRRSRSSSSSSSPSTSSSTSLSMPPLSLREDTTTTREQRKHEHFEPKLLRFEDVCPDSDLEALDARTSNPARLRPCTIDLSFIGGNQATTKNILHSAHGKKNGTQNAAATDDAKTPSNEEVQEETSASNPTSLRLIGAEYLTASTDPTAPSKRVLWQEFEFLSDGNKWPEWFPGDAIGVLCPNSEDLVKRLCKRLNVDPSSRVVVRKEKSSSSKSTLNSSTRNSSYPSSTAATSNIQYDVRSEPFGMLDYTVFPETDDDGNVIQVFDNKKGMRAYRIGDILKWGVDITSTLPRKAFLRMLAEHCTDETDKARLLLLASSNGAEEYEKLISQQRLNLPELLDLFPSASPPLAYVLHLLPSIAPRYYSIVGSPLEAHKGRRFGVAFCVDEYVHKDTGKRCLGMCTGWLEQISNAFFRLNSSEGGATETATQQERQQERENSLVKIPKDRQTGSPLIRAFLRSGGEFRVPPSLQRPVIMIGPGTGVAPFIGFIRHRVLQAEASAKRELEMCSGSWRFGFDIEDEMLQEELEALEDDVENVEAKSGRSIITDSRTRENAHGMKGSLSTKGTAATITTPDTDTRTMNDTSNGMHDTENPDMAGDSITSSVRDGITSLSNHRHRFGDHYLYYGCRSRKEDFLFRKEMLNMESQKIVKRLRVAFSREQKEKVYVQHLMLEDKEEIASILVGEEQEGHVYVCGDGARMAREVHDALVQILVDAGGMTNTDQAQKFLEELQRRGRYVRDVWS